MIEVIFECGGCGAEAKGTEPIRNVFHSLSGKGYGFGTHKQMSVESVTPDGWIAFDPWTQCTYCPECWDSLKNNMNSSQDEGGI